MPLATSPAKEPVANLRSEKERQDNEHESYVPYRQRYSPRSCVGTESRFRFPDVAHPPQPCGENGHDYAHARGYPRRPTFVGLTETLNFGKKSKAAGSRNERKYCHQADERRCKPVKPANEHCIPRLVVRSKARVDQTLDRLQSIKIFKSIEYLDRWRRGREGGSALFSAGGGQSLLRNIRLKERRPPVCIDVQGDGRQAEEVELQANNYPRRGIRMNRHFSSSC